ncbi:MAG: RluA family pseudouridine synthase [Bacteroidota bacterium]
MAKKTPFIHFKDLIQYEDDDILLVNKPVAMASLDDKSNRNLNHLAKKYDPELSLCHRLDKNTSGMLLLAKGSENYKAIAGQFAKRKVRKEYHTLTAGIHQFEDTMVDVPLHVSSNKKVSVNRMGGKPSKTLVNTIKTWKSFSFLRCEPITGRMHQIRVHLSTLGCPIVGDELYGGHDIRLSEIKRKYNFSSRRDEQPINHGYLLHAQSLSFEHPRSAERLTFEAEYPKNFQVALKVLDKYDA